MHRGKQCWSPAVVNRARKPLLKQLPRHWKMGDVVTPKLCFAAMAAINTPEVSGPPRSHPKGPPLLGPAVHLLLPLPPSPPSHILPLRTLVWLRYGMRTGHGTGDTTSFSSLLHIHLCIPSPLPCWDKQRQMWLLYFSGSAWEGWKGWTALHHPPVCK